MDRVDRYCLLFCEGAHDQAALTVWLKRLCGWVALKRDKWPEIFERTNPKPGKGRTPDHLHRANVGLSIHQIGGVDKVMGNDGAVWLTQYGLANLAAFGVVVDLDDKTPEDRMRQFHNWLESQPSPPDTGLLQPGAVTSTNPRIGLWLAPDNRSPGSLDRLIQQSFEAAQPDLLKSATSFVSNEPAFRSQADRTKAILGSAGQAITPADPLAAALRKNEGADWVPNQEKVPPGVKALLHFVDQLTGFS